MAGPGLSTLQHVTDRKLQKLAGHRDQFEVDKKVILASVAAASTEKDKLQALLDGFKKYSVSISGSEPSLPNLRKFARQAQHDPSVSASLLGGWRAGLERELDIASRKYEYAALFGNLVIEWIKNPNSAALLAEKSGSNPNDSDIDTGDSFDTVGRAEMHEQRKVWEDYAFAQKRVDQRKIQAYLNDIFDTVQQAKKVKKSPLEKIRKYMRLVMDFKSDLQTPEEKDDKKGPPVFVELNVPASRFNVGVLKTCIKGVLQTDLLAGKKREALVDLQNQPAVLAELVDVLNMDLEGLDTWEWEPTPILLHMRRQLNGKYRVYMDEEIHQAILLHFIGQYFAVKFKNAFKNFYASDAWIQKSHQSMSKKARQRRDYFVETPIGNCTFTVRDGRGKTHGKHYFMTQLPDSFDDEYQDYGDDEDRKSTSTDKRSALETKQAMLRLITAELMVNTKIYGNSMVWQSDFKWFGPSLPHDTIFAVLQFFGVPEKWQRFFRKFLEVPVAFSHDGPDAAMHVRRCGIPMSHMISDVLSEAVLFCLDFAINKRTHGANLYRFHDDLWFFGQETACVKAWHALEEFTAVMGLELNSEKSGVALVVADKTKPRSVASGLPQGKIKWGFLTLDSEAGRWVIDRDEVNKHIGELHRQLGACRSVMSWVQAWNSYMDRFFTNNFGNPANCFGQQHNEMIIDTFAHIQRSLFAESGAASVTDHLRGMLKERFGTDDSIPDGFFYFPVEAGGLGLRNPFVKPLMTYKDTTEHPEKLIDRAFEDEREEYERLKERWDSGEHRPKGAEWVPLPNDDAETDNEAGETFMSFEEYTRYREETSMPLFVSYDELMECPKEELMDETPAFRDALSSSGLDGSPYWVWIFSLYMSDMQEKFGGKGLQLGERDLLPVGLVGVLKSERVRWEG